MATVTLLVGLPAAGKTTRARQLAARALVLTPDEWMLPLFGDPEADGRRDVLEGRLLRLAAGALRLGVDVVLDFGCWTRDERSAIRWLAGSVGAACVVEYLAVDRATQLRRLGAPDRTLAISVAEADRARELFQEPDEAELAQADPPAPPPGWSGWADWARHRWPSFAID